MDRRMIARTACGALGLIAGVLMLTIGFWRTLLLIALTAAGWALSGDAALHRRLSALVSRVRNPDSNGKDA